MENTPGPWVAIPGSHGNQYCTVYGAERGIAVVRDLDHYRKGESEANAHLIAAAPELLDALETMLDRYAAITFDPEFIAYATSIINKAKGGN